METCKREKISGGGSKLCPIFGSHTSVAGGIENGFFIGKAAGCDCLQIFVKNQRQWKASPLSEQQVERVRLARLETGLNPVVAHASYLLNLASAVPATRRMSIEAMIDEFERCERLSLDGLVFHPGAHQEETLESGIRRVAESLNQVHRSCAGFRCRILLEGTAGQGTAIGHRFEQLAAILERVREPERLGVCLDTCHLFAAGYDFRKPQQYAAMIEDLDRIIGIKRVRCIHMNDSKRELGSRVDRHEHIGKGRIGKVGFAHFVNDVRLAGIPMILETPKGKDGRGTDLDKVNLKRLRSLVR